jgi:hypothetical protein
MEAALANARAGFAAMKPLLADLESAKSELAFRVPGHVLSSTNWTKETDRSVRLQVSGARILGALEHLITDESALKAHLRSSGNPLDRNAETSLEFNRLLFGESKPVRAEIRADVAPTFGYEAEVAAARAETLLLHGTLGVEVPPVLTRLQSLRVGGVHWVRANGDRAGARPFQSAPGYSLAFVAEFSQPALRVTGGPSRTALTDDGKHLLPTDAGQRRLSRSSLSPKEPKARPLKPRSSAWDLLRRAPPTRTSSFSWASPASGPRNSRCWMRRGGDSRSRSTDTTRSGTKPRSG